MLAPRRRTTLPFASTIWLPCTCRPPVFAGPTGVGVGIGEGAADGLALGVGDGAAVGDGLAAGVGVGVGLDEGVGRGAPPSSDAMVAKPAFSVTLSCCTTPQ